MFTSRVTTSWFTIGLLVSTALLPSGQAVAKDRPTLPKNVSWVVDDTDPIAIASALSVPWSAQSGPRHQGAIHAVVLAPALRDPVLAAITDKQRRAVVAAEVDAALQLRRLTKPQPKLPAWLIKAPASAADLRAAYDAAQKETGVEWHYLAAVNFVETKFGRIRGTSIAGAQGPMQFLPSTWKQYGKGGDINSDKDSIAAAARFLKAQGAPKNMRKALFRYNNSKLYVDAVVTYATNMAADPAMLDDYHGWNVFYRWTEGDVVLQQGYTA
jgi:membrane-bound lytic murein transglycosylase B